MIRSYLAFIYHWICWGFSYPVSLGRKIFVLFDYLHLYHTKGLNRNEYYQFEFEKRSKKFRDDFLGENEQRLYLDLLNPVKYYILARNKYFAHKVLENTGIRKATLLCYYQPESSVQQHTDIATNITEVLQILQAKSVTTCVIKTTESSHGDNVWVIQHIEYHEDDAILKRFDGKMLQLSEVLRHQPLLFESKITQNEQFANFNASSVNTVRCMTALYPNGEATLVAAFIKIGRSGSCVDNAGGGGNVDVNVNLHTGEIEYAIQYDGWRQIRNINKHPDSGAPLQGVIIQHWTEIKEQVLAYQQAFPYCKVAGWDIAVTPEGAVVVEVNDMWDRTGQYFIRRGWRPEIRKCYLAWQQYYQSHPDCAPTMGRLNQRLKAKHLDKIVNR